MSEELPAASVIVCTRNRADLLATCIASVFSDASKVSRELVIVDNGSSDGTSELVERLAQGAPIPVTLTHEQQPGLSRARNRGLARARGRFMLYLDDDAVVVDGWADGLVDGFSNPAVGITGGKVVPECPDEAPSWALGCIDFLTPVVDHGPVAKPLRPIDAMGVNIAFRRSALSKLGTEPFDTRLGYRGDYQIGGEETAVVEKLAAGGWVFEYAPRAVVRHLHQAEQLEPGSLARRAFQRGVGVARVDLSGPSRSASVRRRTVLVARSGVAVGCYRLGLGRGRPGRLPFSEHLGAFGRLGQNLEYLLGGRYPGLVDAIASRAHFRRLRRPLI